ncbi:hypothetical protein G9A89_005803 [Geosiphon pyriformis]|nr:hypothetical protein G9A89_005803 [Geosiphon pyriformis]
MNLASSFAGGPSSVSAGLGFQSSISIKKKARVESVYFRSSTFKKMKKPGASGIVIDSSARPLSVNMLQANSNEHAKSWDSKMDSKENSISEVLDVKNMKNMVAEETSYIDSNAFKTDDIMNDTTLKMTCTRTYILRKLPKKLPFNILNDNDVELVLPAPKFVGSNRLPLTNLHVKNVWNFDLKNFFALDVDLSAVPDKTSGASTSSKFSGIIRSFFTSESSLKKARDLAVSKKILVNDEIRKINNHSDREVIVRKISVDLPNQQLMQLIGLWQKIWVEFESSDMASIITAKWSVLMEKDSVRVALAVGNKQTWISRDYYRTLFYTLPIGTTAYDLSKLLVSYSGRTYFISHNPVSYAHDRCAMICFDSEKLRNDAIGSLLVFRKVNLRWAGLSLTCCAKCD